MMAHQRPFYWHLGFPVQTLRNSLVSRCPLVDCGWLSQLCSYKWQDTLVYLGGWVALDCESSKETQEQTHPAQSLETGTLIRTEQHPGANPRGWWSARRGLSPTVLLLLVHFHRHSWVSFCHFLSAPWLQPACDSLALWILRSVSRNTFPHCKSQTQCDFSLSYLSSWFQDL